MAGWVGKQLGAYQVQAVIGRGGMATVYRAYHPLTGRNVAVKVLMAEIAQDEEFSRRFEREARVVASLQHIHILPLFDYGEQLDEQDNTLVAYLVMPYLPDSALTRKIKQGRLTLAEASRIFRQLASALDYAHARGILHRDIKPDNIMIDDSGNALLSDFGLTRIVDATGVSRLTKDDTVMGTPAYMSPEQGQGRDLDERSDLYSLGVVLYEMLTGDVPFKADTPVGVIFKHISDPIRPVGDLNPDLPLAVEEVVEKALSKAPDDRYPTAMAIADALDAAISGEENRTTHIRLRAGAQGLTDGELNTQQVQRMNQQQNAAGLPPTFGPGLAEMTGRKAKDGGSTRLTLLGVGALLFGLLLGAGGLLLLDNAQEVPPTPTVLSDEMLQGTISAGVLLALTGNAPTITPTFAATETATVTPSPVSTDMLQIGLRLTERAQRLRDTREALQSTVTARLTEVAREVNRQDEPQRAQPSATPSVTSIRTADGEQAGVTIFSLFVYPSVAWASDNNWAVVGNTNNEVMLVDMARNRLLQRYRVFGTPLSLAWSPDDAFIAVGDANGNLLVWDVEAQGLIYDIEEDSPSRDVAWSPDGRYLASMSLDGLRVYDMFDDAALYTYYDARTGLAMDWSPDSQALVIGEHDGVSLLEWDTELESSELFEVGRIENETAGRNAVVRWSPAWEYIAIVDAANNIVLLDPTSFEAIRILEGPTERVRSVDWSKEGDFLVVASDDKKIRLYDAHEGKLIDMMQVGSTPYDAQFSPDGATVAVVALRLYRWNWLTEE